MLPLGKCPRRIAPAAAMVDDFKKKKNTTKTHVLPSVLTVDQRKKLSNLKTCREPSTQVLGATSHDPNPYATSQVEELSYNLSYQT